MTLRGGWGSFYSYHVDLNFWVWELCHGADTSWLAHCLHTEYGGSEKKSSFRWFCEGFSPYTFKTCANKEVRPLWDQKFWERLTIHKAYANPFEVFVQIMIIRFTLNWMMKSKQVRRNAWRIVSLKQYHAWPSHQANVYLSCKLLINAYAETIKSPGFNWRILCHGLKRETNISLVSSRAWSAASSPQSMFCICSWASLLSGWNKQLSSAITDQFVRVESPSVRK